MKKEIQKTGNQTLQISSQNWQQSLEILPVRSDTPAAELISHNTPALSELGRNAIGGMLGMTILKALITSLVEFLGSPMNESQIKECAQLAYDEYYWFTLAEAKQFFLRIKMGAYASHKNFTPPVLMEFFREYSQERLNVRYEHYSQQKQAEILHEEAKPLTDDQMQLLRQQMEDIARQMGEPLRQIGNEEEYQRLRADNHLKLLQKRFKEDEPI